MRLIIALASFLLFISEFLSKQNHHSLYLKYFSDKELHFLAFLIFPFFIYVILSKYKFAYILTSIIFFILTYYVEVLQKLLGYRCYSIQDFKYSLAGFLTYMLLILLLKALSYKEKALE
jgi:hypothetical protein